MNARRLTIAALFLLLTLCGCGRRGVDGASQEEERKEYRFGFDEDAFGSRDRLIANGETFFGMLGKMGVPSEVHYPILQACDSTFDVRKIRAGQTVVGYYDNSDSLCAGCPEYIVYHGDLINKTVFHCKDSIFVNSVQMPVDRDTLFTDVTITSSLWNDMLNAGASPLLILKLSDIYAWTVDFFGLQEGDRFRAVYGKTSCEGETISIDTIYLSAFSRGEKDLYAVMYNQGDGGNVYWNEKGESMRKAFLKAPLQFSRISSGFSYHRKHPISVKVKAHTGID
ncbi:MAG: hypothetical protein MJY45_01255 [Bacteroidales bacterium]|nr:hypothetical protein [Bacteroidales bacterium]